VLAPTHTRTRILHGVAATATLGALALGPAAALASSTPPATAAVAEPARYDATAMRVFDAFDANQGIAVDDRHFYAVDNRSITKHDKATGRPVLQFVGAPDGPIEHLDSGVVVRGKLYAAHSNYPTWPMESSIEVFDARTMEHVGTHSFGIYRGSLTWLDWHDNAWWAAFANYDRVQRGQTEPYGHTANTKVVKMDRDFQVVASWTIPEAILDTFGEMSNSGGSWGPDGRLWLTGHDLPEAYIMELPDAGGELSWVATVSLPGIQGQGIAWEDQGRRSTLWGISRAGRQAVQFDVPFGDIQSPSAPQWKVVGPGQFEQ